MSASYLVDLGATVQHLPSIAPAAGVDGTPASGLIIGIPVDMLYSDTYTNIVVPGGVSLSGAFRIAVQTSDALTSGSFTDPTSGLPAGAMPTSFLSGGLYTANSGAALSGTPCCSGVVGAAAVQRPHRYARALILSGSANNAPAYVSFMGQFRTTGSGAGFTFSPGSGTVQV